MSRANERRELGMDRRIPRRDFLNGLAIGVTGAYAAATATTLTPPAAHRQLNSPRPRQHRTLQRVSACVAITRPRSRRSVECRPGRSVSSPRSTSTPRETYDLVIVGAGISGLSAAHFWRRALGAEPEDPDPRQPRRLRRPREAQRVPLRRPHVHRLRRHAWASRRRIRTATRPSGSIEELGIEVERNAEFLNRDAFQKLDLGAGDVLRQGTLRRRPPGRRQRTAAVAGVPREGAAVRAARADLIRLYGKNPDYLAGMSADEKIAELDDESASRTSCCRHAKVHPEALPFFGSGRPQQQAGGHDAGARSGAARLGRLQRSRPRSCAAKVPAVVVHVPLSRRQRVHRAAARQPPDSRRAFPRQADDGDDRPAPRRLLDSWTSAARRSVSGWAAPSCACSTTARRSTHRRVRIAYLRDGKVHGVRAANVILACYNALIPSLMPELPGEAEGGARVLGEGADDVQQRPRPALDRRSRSWASSNVSSPGMLHTGTSLDPGSTSAATAA